MKFSIQEQRRDALALAEKKSREEMERHFALEIFDDIGYSIEVYPENEVAEMQQQGWNYVEE
jgi:hypothetical protein